MGQHKSRSVLPESMNRKRRILGRVLNQKQLPPFVYRTDGRTPTEISATGFQPWNPDGDVSLFEHVRGSFDDDSGATKLSSQWVSTSAFRGLAQMDARLIMALRSGFIYKINTATAVQTGEFRDVNNAFDTAGRDNDFSDQREYAKRGGIAAHAITAYLTGEVYAKLCDTDYVRGLLTYTGSEQDLVNHFIAMPGARPAEG